MNVNFSTYTGKRIQALYVISWFAIVIALNLFDLTGNFISGSIIAILFYPIMMGVVYFFKNLGSSEPAEPYINHFFRFHLKSMLIVVIPIYIVLSYLFSLLDTYVQSLPVYIQDIILIVSLISICILTYLFFAPLRKERKNSN